MENEYVAGLVSMSELLQQPQNTRHPVQFHGFVHIKYSKQLKGMLPDYSKHLRNGLLCIQKMLR